MSEVAKTIAHVESQIAKAKKAKDTLAAFHRLEANKDFKALILDEWCVKSAASFAAASVLPISEANRANALGSAQAPGYFHQWLHAQKTNLQQAIDSLGGLEEDLTVLNTQQAEEDQARDNEVTPVDLVV